MHPAVHGRRGFQMIGLGIAEFISASYSKGDVGL